MRAGAAQRPVAQGADQNRVPVKDKPDAVNFTSLTGQGQAGARVWGMGREGGFSVSKFPSDPPAHTPLVRQISFAEFDGEVAFLALDHTEVQDCGQWRNKEQRQHSVDE